MTSTADKTSLMANPTFSQLSTVIDLILLSILNVVPLLLEMYLIFYLQSGKIKMCNMY